MVSPASAFAADYHVGPGQQYSTIGSVPWYSLKGGDTVYIHYQSTPYREKILISGTGSPSAWIKVTGVPDPSTGALPVISGNGATTGSNMHYRWTDSSGVNAIQHLGLIQIAIQAPTNGVDASLPAYIEISNLQLQDAGGGNGYKFTGENGTQGAYDDFAACIYVKSAQHVVIKNNIITNCGNGFYDWEGGGYSGGNTWFDGLTKDLKIIGNYFYSNGTPGNYNDHQLYTEAEDVLIEGNHFGTVRSGMYGSQIKDRSAGTIVRYNYIEQAPSSWDIDLVEPQEGWPVLGSSPKYKQTFVYGNIIVNTIAPDNSDVVHWNEDHYLGVGRAVPADGRLFFYNNTVINKPNQATYPVNSVFNETQGGFDCPNYTMNGVVDLRNNIFYINGPGVYQFGYCGTYRFNFANNWISPGYTVKAAGSTGQNTNISPTSNDPGFVNFAGGDYRLASNSSARGIGGALAPEVKSNNLGQDFTPNYQYLYRAKLSARSDSGQGSNAGALSDSNGTVVTPTPTPVTAASPTVTLTGSGQIYNVGGSVTLTWSSSNATAVYLSGPYATTAPPPTAAFSCSGTQVALNGSQVVSPSVTSWYVACAQGTSGQLVSIGTYQVYNYATVGNPTPTPTAVPTSQPTPTPTVASNTFYVGQQIQTTANLNVRASASATATILGTQQIGSFGTVVGGPVNQGGFNWWQVNYDIGADGWSVEDYMAPSYSAPTPTPTAYPTITPTSQPTPVPTIVTGSTGSTLFPSGSWFYRNVSGYPLDAENTLVTTALNRVNWGWGALKIDFSIDVLKADANTPVRSFTTTQDFWSPDCDSTPMPVPTNGNLEGESGYQCTGNGDCHLIVVDPSRNKLFEMWRANIVGGTFYGGCMAVWDTTKTYTVDGGGRGMQCTSADAAGYPITPLLVNADEVYDAIYNNKPINHALRFILPNERIRAGVLLYPATHTSGSSLSGDVDMPPYGTLLRLRPDYPVNNLPTAGARAVAKAMQTYGMYLADGGNIALTFQSDSHTAHKWSEVGVDPNSMVGITPKDFQMVDGGSRMKDGAQCVRTPITTLPSPNTNPTPTPVSCVPPPVAYGCTATLVNQTSCQYSVSCPNPTPTPTIAPTPTPTVSTSGKFYVGQRVQALSNLNVRSTANTTGSLLGTEPLNGVGTVSAGFVSQGGYIWWQVKYDDGLFGWSVEDFLASYFESQPTVTPVPITNPTGGISIGSRIQLNSFANVRSSPGYASSISGPQSAGVTGTVTNGPINQGGVNWWSVNYDNGVDGWTEEPYITIVSGGGSSTPTPTPASGTNGGPAGYTFCANEYQSCSFSGTKSVAYGLNGTYVYKTLVGGAVCINATFGDPLPGVDKVCYVSSSTTVSPTPTPLGTPIPTIVRSPVPTPAPKFVIGDTVQPTVYLSVRSSPAGLYLGSQAPGSTGTVVEGPIYKNNNQWWKIDYATGKDGWSSQRYLVK